MKCITIEGTVTARQMHNLCVEKDRIFTGAICSNYSPVSLAYAPL